MISVVIKKTNIDQSEEAKELRDGMLSTVLDNYQSDTVKVARWGKPYLENCNVGFSVSHSGSAILSAVNCERKATPQKDGLNFYFEGGNDFEIGADIEVLGKRKLDSLLKISNKRFSSAEKQLINESLDKEAAVLEVWTKKEAYLKLTGDGLKGIADSDTEQLKKDYIFYTQKVDLDNKEYILSVCVKR